MAFEHVGGPAFGWAADALAMDGPLVSCGWHGGRHVELDLMSLARGRRSLIGLVNRTLDYLHRCLEHVRSGELRPAIAGVYEFEDAVEAVELLEERRAFGKVVLRLAAEGSGA